MCNIGVTKMIALFYAPLVQQKFVIREGLYAHPELLNSHHPWFLPFCVVRTAKLRFFYIAHLVGKERQPILKKIFI